MSGAPRGWVGLGGVGVEEEELAAGGHEGLGVGGSGLAFGAGEGGEEGGHVGEGEGGDGVDAGGAGGGVDGAGAEVEVLEAGEFFGEGDVDGGVVVVEGGGVGWGGVEDEQAGHGSLLDEGMVRRIGGGVGGDRLACCVSAIRFFCWEFGAGWCLERFYGDALVTDFEDGEGFGAAGRVKDDLVVLRGFHQGATEGGGPADVVAVEVDFIGADDADDSLDAGGIGIADGGSEEGPGRAQAGSGSFGIDDLGGFDALGEEANA